MAGKFIFLPKAFEKAHIQGVAFSRSQSIEEPISKSLKPDKRKGLWGYPRSSIAGREQTHILRTIFTKYCTVTTMKVINHSHWAILRPQSSSSGKLCFPLLQGDLWLGNEMWVWIQESLASFLWPNYPHPGDKTAAPRDQWLLGGNSASPCWFIG